MALSWTKTWAAVDDGTTLGGRDLRTLQDDIDAGVLARPVADSDLQQITTAAKVHASAITGLMFWENELLSYENEVIFLS